MLQQHSSDLSNMFSVTTVAGGINHNSPTSFANNTTAASLQAPTIGSRRHSGEATTTTMPSSLGGNPFNVGNGSYKNDAPLPSSLQPFGGARFSNNNNNIGNLSEPPSLTTRAESDPSSVHYFNAISPVQQNAGGGFPASKLTRAGSGMAGSNGFGNNHNPSPATSSGSLLAGMHQPHHHHHFQQHHSAAGWASTAPGGGGGMGSRYNSDGFSDFAYGSSGGGGVHHHHHHHQHYQYHQPYAAMPMSQPGINTNGVVSGHLHHNHFAHHQHQMHHQQHQQHHHHHHPGFRHRDNSAAVENEDVTGVVVVAQEDLNKLTFENLGRCTVSDIRTDNHIDTETYHSENQKETIVVAKAYLHETRQSHQIQRIMVGQLWMEFVKDVHAVGRLMAFIANEPVTIFGMVPNDMAKQGQARNLTIPTMVGFWLSIDKLDHPDGLLDLQRASVLFSKKGILAAFTPQEHRRLLEIADRRRSQGNTGLPESPMTLEAAKNPPKRQSSDGKEMEVFRYYPPKDHRWPQTRGGFQPFVTRWEMSLKEDEGRFAPDKSFALVGTEMGKLKPWGKRVVAKLKMGKLHQEDEEVVPHEMTPEDNGVDENGEKLLVEKNK